MPRLLVPALVSTALLAATPAGAAVSTYRASFSANQKVSWRVDGTRGNCEVRRGVGSGTAKFHVASPKRATIAAGKRGGKLTFTGSIPSVAKGTIAGSFTDSVATACPGQEPSPAVVDPTDGCGPTKFGVRVDFTAKGAFVFITGPQVPLGPVSLAQSGGSCPFLLTGSFLESTDFARCGDGTKLYKRSWGIADAEGQGLLASKIHLTPKQLPKGKRKRSFPKRTAIDCTMPSSYSGGVHIEGVLQATLTLKRF